MEVSHRKYNVYASISPAASAVVKALVYFDIFKYPLTLPEIQKYAAFTFHHLSELEEALRELQERLVVYRFAEFYSLQNDYSLITRRQAGNMQALQVMEIAFNKSKFIHKFPFVRSVNISGSLSKNYFDASTDIDFFIIAKAGRIWLCRLLLTIYKKVFLLNSRKYFCINYYVDVNNMEIPDKNLFSATEIVTLNNQTGAFYYEQFIADNSWVQTYFPNFRPTNSNSNSETVAGKKQLLEKILSGKPGDWLESLAFRLTRYFIARKYKQIEKDKFEVNLRTNRTASKHHPQGFQFKVLNAFDNTCAEIESKHNITLQ